MFEADGKRKNAWKKVPPIQEMGGTLKVDDTIIFMFHAGKSTSVAEIYKSVDPSIHLSVYLIALESHSVTFLHVLFLEWEKMPVLWELKYFDH